MESSVWSIVLLVLVTLVVVGVLLAKRKGLLSGSPKELREADRAEDAARAAPYWPGNFEG